MLSLFLGSSDQRLKESKTDVNISIAFWVLMVQDNLLDIIFPDGIEAQLQICDEDLQRPRQGSVPDRYILPSG